MPSLWERLYGLATMPEEQAQGQVRGLLSGLAGGAAETVKVPGQLMQPNPYPPGSEEAAFYDASKTAKSTEWAPEMALNTMGTGGIVGVPVKGAETALGAGILRPKKEPPLIGLLHGTGSPTEFIKPRLPPTTHDLGFHATIDPSITEMYARQKVGTGQIDMMTGKQVFEPEAGIRTKPFLGDFQAALRYPEDAVKWNVPESVTSRLKAAMEKGFVAPRGLLSDMYNISGSAKTWQDQFIPMLQERGYDSLLYPHASDYTSGTKYNTFMAFDPERQVIPRFSPEGISLAEKRGVTNTFDPRSGVPWRLPSGILKKPEAIESLVKDPTKNTFQWWDETYTGSPLLKQISKTNEESQAKWYAAKQDEFISENLLKEYKKGYLPESEFIKGWDAIHGEGAGAQKLEFDALAKADWINAIQKKKAALENKYYGKNNTMTMDEFINANNALSKQQSQGSGAQKALQPVPQGMLAKLDADLAAGKITKEEFDRGFKFVSANTPESGTSSLDKIKSYTDKLYGDYLAGKLSLEEWFAAYDKMMGQHVSEEIKQKKTADPMESIKKVLLKKGLISE